MFSFVSFLTEGQWVQAKVAAALIERMANAIWYWGPDGAYPSHNRSSDIALGRGRLVVFALTGERSGVFQYCNDSPIMGELSIRL